jgi:PAS domain S-box-containing protein
MIFGKPASSPRSRKAPDYAIVAELSALHELSALALVSDEEQLASEAVEKITRLFGTRRFAILTGRPPRRRVVVASGFKAGESPAAVLSRSRNDPHRLVLVFNEGKEDQDALFFEQAQPIDKRLRRLYNVLASRIEERLAFFRHEAQRARMERDLRESEARNRAILDAIPDLMFVYDRDGTYLDYHAAKAALLAAPPGQFLGRNIRDVLPPDAAERLLHGFSLALESGRPQRVEYALDLAGEARAFEARICPLDDRRLLVMARDITDLKQAEADRDTLQNKLAQGRKMESIGRLAGGVAHDFNNMLCAILGHAELALNVPGSPDPVREHLDEIRRAGERSADLTRQLLAFARKQTVSPRRLDLNQAVEGMLNMLRRLIGEPIRLDWQPGPDAGQVRIDPSQLDQILVNLCLNARDAIGASGTIRLDTAIATLDAAAIPALEGADPGEYACLTVRDDGAGMDRETLSRIFEPFFTTKEIGKGTGLGLATVYGAVRQNNGFLRVDSAPGHGSAFQVFLPRLAPGPCDEKTPDAPAPPPAAAGHQTILVVEDDPAILQITTRQLESIGYAVLAADSPEGGLRLARTHDGPIALLMTDVVMPGMNGFELARAVQSVHPDLPCLFMSGYTPADIPDPGASACPGPILQKPFSRDALANAVRQALAKSA